MAAPNFPRNIILCEHPSRLLAIPNQTPLTPKGMEQLKQGLKDGFCAGISGTLDLAKNAALSSMPGGSALFDVDQWKALWQLGTAGGAISSAGTSMANPETQRLAEDLRKKLADLGVKAEMAGQFLADFGALVAMLGDEFGLSLSVGSSITAGFASPDPATSNKLRQQLQQALDLTKEICKAVFNAIGDMSPYEQGYLGGLILEQVAEQVIIIFATKGFGEEAEAARLAKLADEIESSKALAGLGDRLKPVVAALRDVAGGDKAVVEAVADLKRVARGEVAIDGVVLWAEIIDHCFVAGTPILTPTGEKAIELFEVGDEILARPEDSPDAPPRTSAVEKVFRLSGLTLELRVGGRVVTTTEKHPFYVVGQGWTWAGELRPGDLILGADGRSTAVESIVSTNRHETLYNLRVAFDRTYFVGSRDWGFSLWAHNWYVFENGAVKSISNGSPRVLSPTELKQLLTDANTTDLSTAVGRANKALAVEAQQEVGKLFPMLNRPGMQITSETLPNGQVVGIIGQVENSSSLSQGPAAVKQLEAMTASGDYEWVFGQKSVRRATGIGGKEAGDAGRLIPDIIGYRKDGTIDVFEVQSMGQSKEELEAKLNRIKEMLLKEGVPPSKLGRFEVIS